MARSIRIQFPGAVYHIMSRGNARQDIFLCDADRVLFLDILREVVEAYNLICHSYCLMNNHYHLLIETPEANLADAMRRLNSDYSQKFNKLHNRVGHVLQGRYRSILVEKDSYLLEVSRYIVLNPVRAGLVDDPSDWPWSSYLQMVGATSADDLLITSGVLRHFGSRECESHSKFAKFVTEGIDVASPFESMRDPLVLGTGEYIGKVWSIVGDTEQCKYASRDSRFVDRPTLYELFGSYEGKRKRNELIGVARGKCGYTISEIASFLDLHRVTVSRILKKM